MLIPLLLALAQTPPDVRVVAPGKPNAQTPATLMVEPAAMLIVACDSDADGGTTRTEVQECLARSFGAGPVGYIGYADWQKKWLGDQGALPSPFEVDRNGDDRITLDEVQAQFGKLFSRYDKNGDGVVTRAEALTIRARAFDGGDRGGDRPPQGKRRAERIPGGQPDPQSIP